MDAILGRQPNGSPGELGLVPMEIIEAACESAQTHRCDRIREIERRNGKTIDLGKSAAVRKNA